MMSPEAMMCAAFLLGVQTPPPPVDWIDRQPRQDECAFAMQTVNGGRDAAWFEEQQKRDGTWMCFAVVYHTPGGAIVIGSHEQPFKIWVVESLRILLRQQGRSLPSPVVYALAGQAEEKCK